MISKVCSQREKKGKSNQWFSYPSDEVELNSSAQTNIEFT